MCGVIGTIGYIDKLRFKPSLIEHRVLMASARGVQASDIPFSRSHQVIDLDLSDLGSQPMVSKDGRYVFVFNGEIYNFIELRTDLELEGHVFTSDTDSEVFMKGLISEGPSFQNRCNGMWSFVCGIESSGRHCSAATGSERNPSILHRCQGEG